MYQVMVCGTMFLFPFMDAFCVIGYNEHGVEELYTGMYQFALSRCYSIHFFSFLKETSQSLEWTKD